MEQYFYHIKVLCQVLKVKLIARKPSAVTTNGAPSASKQKRVLGLQINLSLILSTLLTSFMEEQEMLVKSSKVSLVVQVSITVCMWECFCW